MRLNLITACLRTPWFIRWMSRHQPTPAPIKIKKPRKKPTTPEKKEYQRQFYISERAKFFGLTEAEYAATMELPKPLQAKARAQLKTARELDLEQTLATVPKGWLNIAIPRLTRPKVENWHGMHETKTKGEERY